MGMGTIISKLVPTRAQVVGEGGKSIGELSFSLLLPCILACARTSPAWKHKVERTPRRRGERLNALLMLRPAIENFATARTSLQIVWTSADCAQRAVRPISLRADGFVHESNISGSRGRRNDVLSARELPVLDGRRANRAGMDWEGDHFGPCADRCWGCKRYGECAAGVFEGECFGIPAVHGEVGVFVIDGSLDLRDDFAFFLIFTKSEIVDHFGVGTTG